MAGTDMAVQGAGGRDRVLHALAAACVAVVGASGIFAAASLWASGGWDTRTPEGRIRAAAVHGSVRIPVAGDGQVEVRPGADGVHVRADGARFLVPSDKLLIDVDEPYRHPSLLVPDADMASGGGPGGHDPVRETSVGYLILRVDDASRVVAPGH